MRTNRVAHFIPREFPDCSLDNSTTHWGYFKDNNLTAENIVEHTNKDHLLKHN